MKTLDLFAGVGGVRLGFERAGFTAVFSNDIEPSCKETFDLNFNKPRLTLGDINKIKIKDLPDFDILLAGFPCQPFSVAGYRKGFKDKIKGSLFFKIAEIIEVKKPLAILLENVKNLQTHDSGRTYKIIKKTLEDLGYTVKSEILNTMVHGGLPQNRERIFIVAFRNPKYAERFNFPEKTKLKLSIKDMLEKNVNGKYYYTGKPLYKRLKNEIKEENVAYQWRRKYVRQNKSKVVPTLTANMGTGGHNVPIILDKNGIRKLTPRECFMLQGFPKNFKLPRIADSKIYKQAGNSVTVTIIEKIAKNIKKAVNGK